MASQIFLRVRGGGVTYERPDGWGTIDVLKLKRPNGSYREVPRGRFWGVDDKGVRKRFTIYGKTEDAVAKKMYALQKKSNQSLDSTKLPLKDFLETWLRGVKANRKFSTFKLYEGMVRLYIIAKIGQVKVGKLASSNLRAFMLELAEDEVGLATRQQVHKILARALQIAVKDELIARNPMVSVEKPTGARPEPRFLNQPQVVRLLEAARETHWYELILLAVLTSMRQGELFALRWNEVFLDEGYLFVKYTLTEDADGKLVYTDPKTVRSRRRVDLCRRRDKMNPPPPG